ncbi:methyltransferase, FkbM family domain protein [Enhygromyxa salina]|uniref:Methyltransferase, FkbM family domain protein n=1 Tax=Enhygromyxa salina TaxID=215803 RepID=A0A0C2CZH8_9BACT|nr:methyltransferase, FkbM family domain protein [Enhygromyxa salina]
MAACSSPDTSKPKSAEATPAAAPDPSPMATVEVDPNTPVEVQGSRMYLNPDDAIISKIIARDHIWEPRETMLFRAAIGPGDVVIDVGANIGYYTLLAARTVGDAGHVFAFEPDPEAFAILERNVKLNGYENVTLVPKALGATDGTLQLYLHRTNRGDHRIYDPSGKRESVDIQMIRLDDFLVDHAGPVDFIKIDTQGAECKILAGAAATLRAHAETAIVMEFSPKFLAEIGDDAATCLGELSALGYSFEDILEWEQRIAPSTPAALLAAYPASKKAFTNLFLPARQPRHDRTAAIAKARQPS